MNRRAILTALLSVAAAPTVAAFPTNDNPYGSSECIQPIEPATVSASLNAIILNFIRLSTALDEIDGDADPHGWDAAADNRKPVLDALVEHRPATAVDLAAKLGALAHFMIEEDSELYVLKILAEDAAVIVGRAG